jgi:hypothetical protein
MVNWERHYIRNFVNSLTTIMGAPPSFLVILFLPPLLSGALLATLGRDDLAAALLRRGPKIVPKRSYSSNSSSLLYARLWTVPSLSLWTSTKPGLSGFPRTLRSGEPQAHTSILTCSIATEPRQIQSPPIPRSTLCACGSVLCRTRQGLPVVASVVSDGLRYRSE